MSDENIDLQFIGRQVERVLDEQRLIRRDVNDVRDVTLAMVDQSRRVERRISEVERRLTDLRDDLELLIKVELGGRMANLETRLETRIDDRLDNLGMGEQL